MNKDACRWAFQRLNAIRDYTDVSGDDCGAISLALMEAIQWAYADCIQTCDKLRSYGDGDWSHGHEVAIDSVVRAIEARANG